MIIPELKIEGRSGCNIEILKQTNQYVVRKSASVFDYNIRLARQYEKQKKFGNNLISQNILTPAIYASGVNEKSGLFYFDMQYIAGEKYSEYFLHCTINELVNLIDQFIYFIDSELDKSEFSILHSEVLRFKIESLAQLLKRYPDKGFTIKKTISFLKEKIPKTPIPVGICHGDLTLSNVIFSNSKLFLIDFLDSFIESPLMDIVKLRQDTKFYWSLLLENELPVYQRNKIIQVLRYFDHCFEDYFRGKDYYADWYSYLEKINMIRILPYLTKKNEIEFVIQTLKPQ